MDVRLTRIVEDLSDSFQGELSVDPTVRALYATDGSLYQVEPLAVAWPQSAVDVATLLKYAAEQRFPVIPRGSGSSVTGGSLGPGIVIDCSRHLTAIENINEESVRCGAGVVLQQLNAFLRPLGRYFPPDPSSAATTTVGGMLAVDAAGSHAISVGSVRDHVREIEFVTSGGELWRANHSSLPLCDVNSPTATMSMDQEDLVHRLRELCQRYATEITAAASTGLLRRSGGYFVYGIAQKETIDLPRLLVGSEGTLGCFTAATLHTLPLPEFRGAMLILFETLEAAARAVTRLTVEEPAACDLLDRRLLSLGREASTEFARLIPQSAEAALILEWSGWSSSEVLSRLDRYQRLIREFGHGCTVQCETTSPAGADFLWSLPQQVVPLLLRLPGVDRALPFVEDIAVPPAFLEEFIFRAQKTLQRHGMVASLYAHAPTGQVHLRPFLPAPRTEDAPRLQALAHELYEAAWHLGGTISGEHGLGLVRSGFLKQQAGPLYPLFQEIKNLFDPHNLLNPGKVITDDADLLTQHLRAAGPSVSDVHEIQLNWPTEEVLKTADACNGCGRCRSHEPELRMCPLFRCDATEAASPRAKANLVRQTLHDDLPPFMLASPEFKQVSDLCFNCRQCRIECPSRVDIPHLVHELRAQYVAQHGLPRSLWFLTRAMDWGDWLNRASPVLNHLLSWKSIRWLTERLFGVARQRQLPRFAAQSFLSQIPARYTQPPLRLTSKTVIYFVDYFANHHDPELAHATLQILERNGYEVHVPPRQQRCGMELIAAGDLEWARAIAENNIRFLVEFAREGCPIVCSEPTAAVCLREDYPLVINSDDARVVADHTFEIGAFLEQRHTLGQLDVNFVPVPVRAHYHTPCHLKALGLGTPLFNLCSLIPHVETPKINAGCSGMAGMFGMEAKNYARSIEIGNGLQTAMNFTGARLGLTECSSCQIQMGQLSQQPIVHPLKLLALGYGLLPELRRQLLLQSSQP
ncbi:FAD-binding protein [bacterium]|nr:FAD-binding protein [bacterium]